VSAKINNHPGICQNKTFEEKNIKKFCQWHDLHFSNLLKEA